jgi:DNA-binding transcriptional LysR family regulator
MAPDWIWRSPPIGRTHCEYWSFLAETLSREQIRPEVTFRTSQDSRALDLVRAGLSVGIFPESLIPAGMPALELRDQSLECQVFFVRKRGK